MDSELSQPAAFDQDSHSAGQYLELGPPPQTSSSNDTPTTATLGTFFVSKFRRVVNVVFFVWVIPRASEFYVLTFQTSFKPQEFSLLKRPMKMEQSVSKRRHIKFERRRIAQKKEYSIKKTRPETILKIYNTLSCS